MAVPHSGAAGRPGKRVRIPGRFTRSPRLTARRRRSESFRANPAGEGFQVDVAGTTGPGRASESRQRQGGGGKVAATPRRDSLRAGMVLRGTSSECARLARSARAQSFPGRRRPRPCRSIAARRDAVTGMDSESESGASGSHPPRVRGFEPLFRFPPKLDDIGAKQFPSLQLEQL